MAGMFDDLVPVQRQLISPNMFADLIPQTMAQAPDLSNFSDAQLQQMLQAKVGTDLSRYSDAELQQMLQARGSQAGQADDSW